MVMNVEVNVSKKNNIGEKTRDGITKYLKKGADRGVAEASDKVPVDRGAGGGLLSGIFTPEEQGDKVVWGIRDMPHARPIEFGTEPGHTPPISPLVEWAKRIGKSEGFGIWVATEKIPEEGVSAQPYMRPAREAQIRWYKNHSVDSFISREFR